MAYFTSYYMKIHSEMPDFFLTTLKFIQIF